MTLAAIDGIRSGEQEAMWIAVTQASLPSLQLGEQGALPASVAECRHPPAFCDMGAAERWESLEEEPNLNQLSLGPNQEVLWNLEPEPKQLALLFDPFPWETDPCCPRPYGRGHPAKDPQRVAVTPGQISFF